MYFLMGHTAMFAMGLSTSSGIVQKEPLEPHESVGP